MESANPYIEIFMHRYPGTDIPQPQWPEGYKATLYQEGDELSWAEIMASVLEFDSPRDAWVFFSREYMPLISELRRRLIFIRDAAGEPVGTALIWWRYAGVRRNVYLEWLAVSPDHQKKGLGGALVAYATGLMRDIEGDTHFYLKTQTGSDKAIHMFEHAGFSKTDEREFTTSPGDRHDEELVFISRMYDFAEL